MPLMSTKEFEVYSQHIHGLNGQAIQCTQFKERSFNVCLRATSHRYFKIN